MLQYQLPVAIVLAVSAACSLVVFVVLRPREGKIQLPTDGEEVPQRDPFDVTKPTDFIDGTPVDAEAFWFRVRDEYLIGKRITYFYSRCAYGNWP